MVIPGISIIVPTLGRPTLRRTLDSIISQASDLDQLVVVFDGMDCPIDAVDTLFADFAGESVIARIEHLGEWGHLARNYALDHIVTRTRVMTMDDDDVYTPGAFDMIRRALEGPPAVHVFGCKWGPGHPAEGIVLPRGRGLMVGEIATPMVVAPTCMARYDADYHGDFVYAQRLAETFPVEDWVWHPDEIICEVRP